MKPTFLITLFAAVLALTWSALPSFAQTTYQTGDMVVGTDTYTNVVVNSTYTFSNLPEGTQSVSAYLEDTAISQSDLNAISPPVNFQLDITSLDYVDTSTQFVGNNTPVYIDVSFQFQPSLNQGGQLTGNAVLVFDTTITGTVTGADFHLLNPIMFPISDGSNIGNLASGPLGTTWENTIDNIHPVGSGTLTINGQSSNYNYNANAFSNLGGSLEVIYAAVPEPGAGRLSLVAAMALVAIFIARRNSSKSAD